MHKTRFVGFNMSAPLEREWSESKMEVDTVFSEGDQTIDLAEMAFFQNPENYHLEYKNKQ